MRTARPYDPLQDLEDWQREYRDIAKQPEPLRPETQAEARRRIVRKLVRFVWALPPTQGYRITQHDPPRDGYLFTVQLVGPPLMHEGRYVG